MPETYLGWCWLVFFTGGALGGWGLIGLAAPILFDEGRRILKQRRGK